MNATLFSEAREFARSLTPASFHDLAAPRIGELFTDTLESIGAHAGSIWLKPPDAGALVVAFNVGDGGRSVVGKIEQPLDSGLVSKAFREQQTIYHRGVYEHPEKSDRVDQQLGQWTAYQIAVPLSLFGETCGAVTAIQTYEAGMERKTRWGFEEIDVARFERWVAGLTELLEYTCVKQAAE